MVIISHKYKFIFIRVPKTASTSLQFTLGKICGDEDIVSTIRVDTPSGHVPRNYLGYRPHITAKEITEKISSDIWENYFKFCFERNPFDKIVSYYWWRIDRGTYNGTFRDFCLDFSRGNTEFPKSHELYTMDGKIAVDFVGKYESLESDFDFICQKLKLPIFEKLTQEKSHYRKSKLHYSSYYDAETKKIVENRYSNEIKWFNYQFEEKT